MIRELLKGLLSILIIGLFAVVDAQDDNFDYENWPGKDGAIRHRIELPVHPFLGYGLELKPGYNDSSISFALPLFEGDTVKTGRLKIRIFKTIEKAQLDLLDFLYAIQSPFKPPRLTPEEFASGDVAFGKEYEGILRVYFTRANVRIILNAPTPIAKELAQKVDSLIQAAPVWTSGDPIPTFIISREFLKAFFVKTL